jgi:hypothetical protein
MASARVAGRLWLAALVLLSGCAAVQTNALREQSPPDLAPAAELPATPFFPQTDYQCGPAALATALGAVGIDASPSLLGEQIFLPARTGTLQTEMLTGARRQGAVATRLPGTLEAVLREVAAGHAVVVLQNLGLSFAPRWHYAVVVGYDLATEDVVLRSGTTKREVLAMRTFEHTWVRAGSWAFVALPPGRWPLTAEREAAIEAAVGFERTASPAVARRVYDSALVRWPDDLSLAMGQANTTYAGGDKARAIELFGAIATRFRSAPAWINQATVLLELGRAQEALVAARQALATKDTAWQSQAEVVLQAAQRAIGGN